jgi:hypothetical protein
VKEAAQIQKAAQRKYVAECTEITNFNEGGVVEFCLLGENGGTQHSNLNFCLSLWVKFPKK